MSARLNSPLVCLLATAVIYSVFILGRLYQSNFDFSSFVVAGDTLSDPTRVPEGLTVLKNSNGFDGQFYYRLALNPFTSQKTEFGITLDAPALRHQRILYPFLTWTLSLGGGPRAVPVVMVLINLAGLCALGWIGGHYAQALRQHALWGVFIPLYPGFLLTLSRDLVEIVEIAFVLGSLLLIRRGRPLIATVLLSFAVLTKETALLVALAALVVYLFKRSKGADPGKLKWYCFAAPIVVFIVWQVVLFYTWGVFPLYASSESNLSFPFVAPATFVLNALVPVPQRHALIESIFLIGFTLGVFYHLRRTNASFIEILSWVFYGVLAISLGRVVWTEDWTFLRAISSFCVLGTVTVIAARTRTKAIVFAFSSLFWLYLFIRLMRHYS